MHATGRSNRAQAAAKAARGSAGVIAGECTHVMSKRGCAMVASQPMAAEVLTTLASRSFDIVRRAGGGELARKPSKGKLGVEPSPDLTWACGRAEAPAVQERPWRDDHRDFTAFFWIFGNRRASETRRPLRKGEIRANAGTYFAQAGKCRHRRGGDHGNAEWTSG